MFVDSDVELNPGCIKALRFELEERGWAGIIAVIHSSENLTYWQKSEDENFR